MHGVLSIADARVMSMSLIWFRSRRWVSSIGEIAILQRSLHVKGQGAVMGARGLG
jgi:hypothetical protein